MEADDIIWEGTDIFGHKRTVTREAVEKVQQFIEELKAYEGALHMADGKVTLINDLGGKSVRAEAVGQEVIVSIERSYLSPDLVFETLCGVALDAAGAAELGKRLQVLAHAIVEEA